MKELIKNCFESCENCFTDKTSAAKTPRGKDQKKENKKVVKIILPNANAITKPSVSGNGIENQFIKPIALIV